MAKIVQSTGDISVFSWDSNSLLAVFKNVKLKIAADKADTSPATMFGKRRQTVKRYAEITTGIMSPLSGDATLMASNLAVTAFSIGDTDYIDYLMSWSINGTFDTREVSGQGSAFKKPQHEGKDYSCSVTLTIPLGGTPSALRNLSAAMLDADLVDQDLDRVAVGPTIDGVPITIPMTIDDITWSGDEKTEQTVVISFSGNCPTSGDYPTAPTGTTTLLEQFFNDVNTVQAISLTTHATEGVNYAGNFLPGPFTIKGNDAEVNIIDLSWISQGAVTPSNN